VPVLAKSEIQKRLDEKKIFMPGSWEASGLRSASYDLRVAPDYLIDPDGKRFWPENPTGATHCQVPFSLYPGQVAFVSSVEQLCMPFELAGNIAQKFSVTRSGVLVLGGLLVDPGYGLELRGDGRWWTRERGQRLHFQLANVGDEEFKIFPSKTSVAAIQFLTLDGYVRTEEDSPASVRVPNSDDLLDALFVQGDEEPLSPLAFFPRMADLRGDLDGARDQIEKQKIKLDSTKRSTDQLVVFGVFLLTITLFTVACAALIEAIADGSTGEAADALGNADTSTVLNHEGLIIAVVVAAVVIVFALVSTFSVFTALALSRRHQERKRSKKRSAGVKRLEEASR